MLALIVAVSAAILPGPTAVNHPDMVIIAGDGTRHRFAIGRHEVTWAEYLKSVDEAVCSKPENGYGQPISNAAPLPRDTYPVTGVTKTDVNCFIAWLNRMTGRHFRLPTAAEWLWAARDASPRVWASLQRAAAADATRDDPRDAVRSARVNRVETAEPTSEGVNDLEANATEMLAETRVMDGPTYKKVCEEHGAGFCHQTAVIGFSGVDLKDGVERPYNFREMAWVSDADRNPVIGFRLTENR